MERSTQPLDPVELGIAMLAGVGNEDVLKSVKLSDRGMVVHGTWPHHDVVLEVEKCLDGACVPLILTDPPYGNIIDEDWDRINDVERMQKHDMEIDLSDSIMHSLSIAHHLSPVGGAAYVCGGIGKPLCRPLYRLLSLIEHQTRWTIADHITWKKKRGYGIQHSYLFTREEIIYLINGDPHKPRMFNVPYLDKKRGYPGYNKKYPARSEYLRRTNVWDDVTEILKGKMYVAQKPVELFKIPILAHTAENEWVLDMYAGSGTTALACLETGRKFICVEEKAEVFDLIMDRISSA